MSPRRSSRARTSQPSSGGVNHSGTSSSTSSSRGDRGTRATGKSEEPLPSATPASPSSEEVDGQEAVLMESRRTRQSRRDAHEEEQHQRHEDVKQNLTQDNDDGEDEGVTRCICGQAEYPGPPYDLMHLSVEGIDALPEDAGAMFIQCDVCQVWQHGGCVGILDEAMSPENYYCEQCRRDLHNLHSGSRGRYSFYIPVKDKIHDASARKSVSSRDGDPRSPKDSDAKTLSALAAAQSAKRRSTMNSRAAYDEEEVMRRVIEESKTEGSGEGTNGSRKTKRGRDGSADAVPEFKRRKTGSESATPPNGRYGTHDAVDSENELSGRKPSHSRRRGRGDAFQVQREKELRERELEKERERAEAAGRRKGRAERRRIDESEPPEEPAKVLNSTIKSAAVPARSNKSQQAAPRRVAEASLVTASTAHKKNGRPVRRGRLGRNQYTRDRDSVADSGLTSPHPSHSRDEEENGVGEDEVNSGINGNGSKPSKPRMMNPNRTSMNDMKRRVAGILEYISRTQVEMAGEKSLTAENGVLSKSNNSKNGLNGSSKLSHEISHESINGDAGETETEVEKKPKMDRGADGGPSVKVEEDAFIKLNSLDMMDVLTRELLLWQKEHGKWR